MNRPTVLAKRSLTVAGHRTSVSVETVFWTELQRIAHQRGHSVARLVAEVDRSRAGANLSSALRVFVLEQVMQTRDVDRGSQVPCPAHGEDARQDA